MSRQAARHELEQFFRRREERGKFYCRSCLVEHLSRRGPRSAAAAEWGAAVDDTLTLPGPFQFKPHGPCDTCRTPSFAFGLHLSADT